MTYYNTTVYEPLNQGIFAKNILYVGMKIRLTYPDYNNKNCIDRLWLNSVYTTQDYYTIGNEVIFRLKEIPDQQFEGKMFTIKNSDFKGKGNIKFLFKKFNYKICKIIRSIRC